MVVVEKLTIPQSMAYITYEGARTVKQKEKWQLRATVRALRYRNFRLFFVGQGVSLIGTWMQRIAVGWLVYRLTDSAFLLGVVGFAGQIPAFVLAPFAGVLADRWNRHRLLILTQALAMMQAFVLAYLVLSGTVVVWQIIVLSLVLGVVTAFDIPVRQSFMIEMIEEKTDLGNAIALNSSMVNGARLLRPSVAGLLIATVGEGMCFLFNGLSYLAVIASLLLMRIVQKDFSGHKSRAWHALKEGFKYVYDFEPIRAIILLLALMALMGMPYLVLMPIFARDVLDGGPSSLGFLMGASGVGALAGALYLASRRGVLGLGKMIPIGAGIFGLGLIAFALSRNFFWSLTLLIAVGFGQMVQLATSNTLLQTMVDDDRRGRVMGFFTVAFVGMAPVGSLLAGALASVIGAPWTLFVGGVACLVGAGVFARRLPQLREKVRPIYVTKGILPEIATGIECATDVSVPRK
jgi:MFS family permease